MSSAFVLACAQVFAVDIHPAARFGKGILLDHGTGVVIGETAQLGNNVSILQVGANRGALLGHVGLVSWTCWSAGIADRGLCGHTALGFCSPSGGRSPSKAGPTALLRPPSNPAECDAGRCEAVLSTRTGLG